MSKLPKQTSRKDLIKRFSELGWAGPFTGTGKHPEFMTKGDRTVKIPNPHKSDIREPLLKRILDSAGISIDAWMN